MFTSIRRRTEDEEGFTLIELLVVIIIIGILAAIAIPVFLSQKTKGYEASMKSDLRTVAEEVESQNVDKQSYSLVTFGGGTKTMSTTPATLISGSDQSVGDSTTVRLSAGNTIAVSGTTTASAFCLVAAHTGAKAWYYSSAKGGINSTGC
jgi:type IV pilus assembly protein PilA